MKALAIVVLAVCAITLISRIQAEPATAAGGEVRVLNRIDQRLAQMNQRLGQIRDSLKDTETGTTIGDALTRRGVTTSTVGAVGLADLIVRTCRTTASSPSAC